MGQMMGDIRLATSGQVPVALFSRIGRVPSPDELTQFIAERQVTL
jgi:hypothetical protein